MKISMNTKKNLTISALSTFIALALSSQCLAKTIKFVNNTKQSMEVSIKAIDPTTKAATKTNTPKNNPIQPGGNYTFTNLLDTLSDINIDFDPYGGALSWYEYSDKKRKNGQYEYDKEGLNRINSLENMTITATAQAWGGSESPDMKIEETKIK